MAGVVLDQVGEGFARGCEYPGGGGDRLSGPGASKSVDRPGGPRFESPRARRSR